MPTIAYLANQFPSPLEPYVVEEILELRKCGVGVIPCSTWRANPALVRQHELLANETLYLVTPKWGAWLRALGLCFSRLPILYEFIARVLFRGEESLGRRLKAVLHTALGVYLASLLAPHAVEHIHVHHGYFSSWVAMVASRLLGIQYSLTLHGSDILIHDAYLDIKLEHCSRCFTVSEYNRKHLLRRFPHLDSSRIVVQRLGVDTAMQAYAPPPPLGPAACLVILSVGRLHPVKNHAFLIQACARLKCRGMNLLCMIAGEGSERPRLEQQIASLGLSREVKLLGHLEHSDLEALYPMVDLVVLTSRSEGIPLALMEAMAWGRIVLAPAITGIPELVIDGKTGFLYPAGALDDFVTQIEKIRSALPQLCVIQEAARSHVAEYFDQPTNLNHFVSSLLSQVSREHQAYDAHTILQQV